MLRAHLSLDPDRVIGEIDRRLFGGFVEHLGRCVYDGIYEPGHPEADEHGFRRDVVALVRELGVSTIRYPGGNFVSAYRWEDGIGPREQRPRRLDLAWHSTETNEVGLHEFGQWLDLVGAEMMLALNLGTRGTQEALDLLEYANHRAGTARADQRIANGRAEPFGVALWCLGNEMDGPWQIGHRSAEDYGKLAAMTARAMREYDPGLELVACGSSGHGMATFGEWERTVLGHTYDLVDYVSCHAYYEDRGDTASFLAAGVDMDRFIGEVVAIADEVKAGLGSEKTLAISFDEWNVWYMTRFNSEDKITDPDRWPVAPRLLEDVYTVTDAVVVGSLLITLLRHADRVKAASLAQLVNVIAPIMTEPGGSAWRQTTFHPFAATARHGRGTALDLAVSSATYFTEEYGEVPAVDAVATHDGSSYSVFVVNRSPQESAEVEIALPAGEFDVTIETLADDDLGAANTAQDPDRVVLRPHSSYAVEGDVLRVTVPPVSWSVIRL